MSSKSRTFCVAMSRERASGETAHGGDVRVCALGIAIERQNAVLESFALRRLDVRDRRFPSSARRQGGGVVTQTASPTAEKNMSFRRWSAACASTGDWAPCGSIPTPCRYPAARPWPHAQDSGFRIGLRGGSSSASSPTGLNSSWIAVPRSFVGTAPPFDHLGKDQTYLFFHRPPCPVACLRSRVSTLSSRLWIVKPAMVVLFIRLRTRFQTS